jgi:hypothetical protein
MLVVIAGEREFIIFVENNWAIQFSIDDITRERMGVPRKDGCPGARICYAQAMT